MSSRPSVKRSRNDGGQSLLEFALVAVGLVMLLFGAVEMCRMALAYTTVANAAKAGARYATVNGVDSSTPSGPSSDPSNVVAVIQNFAAVGGLTPSNLTVRVNYYSAGGVSPTCNEPGCWVQVSVSYLYKPLTNYFPLAVNLASTSEGVITF